MIQRMVGFAMYISFIRMDYGGISTLG